MNIINITNLFRAYFIETWKRLLIPCAIIFGVTALAYSFSSGMPLIWSYYVLFFYVAFSAFGFMKNRAHFFTLPAKTSEKFTYVLLVIVALGILFHLLSIAGAYFGAYLIHPLIYTEKGSWYISEVYIFKDNLWSWKEYLDFASLLSIFVFGSIYFKKNAFFKILGIATAAIFVIAFYVAALLYIAFGTTSFDESFAINFANYSFLQTYEYLISLSIAVFFLSLTYLRLRETEV